jgi:NTP pyrophosphatase (non-canonical NTP hydrolase)
MNDKATTFQEIKDIVLKFRDDRDWKQFHDIKNLAEAISIEAGELQELFLWKDKDELMRKLSEDSNFKEKVGEELADVLLYCFNFANSADIDISQVMANKIKSNDEKYPVEKSKSSAAKYTEL